MACTVNGGSLVKALVDARNGCDVDDRTPAGALPDAPCKHFQPHMAGGHKVVCGNKLIGARNAVYHCVDKAVGGEDSQCDSVNDYPADKVGYGGKGLDKSSETVVLYLGKEHCEYHRHPAGGNSEAAHCKSVLENVHDIVSCGAVLEKRGEPLEAHELIHGQVLTCIVVEECVSPAVKREVAEYECQCDDGEHHKEKPELRFHIKVLALFRSGNKEQVNCRAYDKCDSQTHEDVVIVGEHGQHSVKLVGAYCLIGDLIVEVLELENSSKLQDTCRNGDKCACSLELSVSEGHTAACCRKHRSHNDYHCADIKCMECGFLHPALSERTAEVCNY